MRTDKIRFNLSGNLIFKKDKDTIPPKIVVEDSGVCMEDFNSEEEYEAADQYRYEHPTTLRDICILLYSGCGQGVMWQLSRELSERLGVDKRIIAIAVHNIVHEYADMGETETANRYEKYAKYIKIHDYEPEED